MIDTNKSINITVKPELEVLREPVEHKPNWRSARIGGPPNQIRHWDRNSNYPARHLNKEMFCRKIENKKQNKIERRNEIKNKNNTTMENKLNLDK